eukprot:1925517-Amphidinium_carterae.2
MPARRGKDPPGYEAFVNYIKDDALSVQQACCNKTGVVSGVVSAGFNQQCRTSSKPCCAMWLRMYGERVPQGKEWRAF